MNKKGKTQRGITLIALVITIIVMLILVGVTISMAVNGGLFDYAGKAVGDTNNALKTEQQLANGGIEVGGVWYNSIDEYLNKDKVETISKETSYVGYYADIDADGTVDGVIYADLAVGGAGEHYGYEYSYEAETGLKDYHISGTYEGDFGTKGVIATTVTGNDRFYVMALSDVATAQYTGFYWYYNAFGNMSDYETATSTDFGTGKANTATIKEYWDKDGESPYGVQNPRDLWSLIDSNSKWFVPSRDELVAFIDMFDITMDNYGDFGLVDWYWTSSQHSADSAWYAFFITESINWANNPEATCFVRLSATF